MLKRSFVHIPGIGPSKEQKLWDRGIQDWNTLRAAADDLFRQPRRSEVLEALERSESAYARRDFHFFYESLPRDQLWRLLPDCAHRIAYLDIESTGLGMPPASHSTTVTFYFEGKLYQEYEHAKKAKLLEKIRREATLLVTYFGEVFDVPFLEREFDMRFEKPHLDLCFWLKRHGLKGGLKKIQKTFPDIPTRESMDIDGYDAVRLWRMHEKGVPGALDTLLTYNAEDTLVLEPLLVKACELEAKKNRELSSFSAGLCSARPFPKLKTSISPKVYQLLREGIPE